MRAVIQRVSSASVTVDGQCIAEIDTGLLVLLGSQEDDVQQDIDYIVQKTIGLRIFEDAAGKMNLSVQDVSGAILLVSQFTLLGDARKGRRPSFIRAGRPEEAEVLYEQAVARFKETSVPIKTGEFQADMQVASVNHGPVTILLDSKKLF